MRAVSISVTEVSVAGGLIQPGDYVDVLGTFQVFNRQTDPNAFAAPDSQGAKNLVTMTVLQNVQVLAVGQSGQNGSTSSKVSPTKGQPDAKTVTLALTPEDAERVTLGQSTGDFTLALHKTGDHTTAPVQALPNTVSTFTSADAGAASGSAPASSSAPSSSGSATTSSGSASTSSGGSSAAPASTSGGQ
jgi:pilus assembly protein CpaB